MPKKDDKPNVIVDSIGEQHSFTIPSNAVGRQLFDQVSKALDIQEVWFFGLKFTDSKGLDTWLKLKKKVFSQDVGKKKPIYLRFRAKFYPEDMQKELQDSASQRQFYLQTKEEILSSTIFCPPDTAVLLASYAIQEEFGDYDAKMPGFLANTTVLSQDVLKQYELTSQEWEDRIVSFYKDHTGHSKEAAMMDYLKTAQDLETYGVNYFDIKNKKGTALQLGVDSMGLSVCEHDNRLTPSIAFPWSEIRSISFSDKKFTIKPVDEKAPNIIFYASRVKINKHILALCMGNHELFVRRRKKERMSPVTSAPQTEVKIPIMPEPTTVEKEETVVKHIEETIEKTETEEIVEAVTEVIDSEPADAINTNGDAGDDLPAEPDTPEPLDDVSLLVVRTSIPSDKDDFPPPPDSPTMAENNINNGRTSYPSVSDEDGDLMGLPSPLPGTSNYSLPPPMIEPDYPSSPPPAITNQKRDSNEYTGQYIRRSSSKEEQSYRKETRYSKSNPPPFAIPTHEEYSANLEVNDDMPEESAIELEKRRLFSEENKATYDKLKHLYEDLGQAKTTLTPENKRSQELRREGVDKYKTLRLITQNHTRSRIALFENM